MSLYKITVSWNEDGYFRLYLLAVFVQEKLNALIEIALH